MRCAATCRSRRSFSTASISTGAADRPPAERAFRRLGGKPAAGADDPASGHRRGGCRGAFHEQALSACGHEGVMAKAPDAPYEAGGRGAGWLKIKRAHTLDLVVLAAEWGHGRRRGWLSNLHLGARDRETGDFVMLGKTFKGMTDAMLDWQTQRAAGAGDRARRLRRARATRARGRDRVQRYSGKPALSRRNGAALRPRQALPHGQAARGGGHHRHGAGAVPPPGGARGAAIACRLTGGGRRQSRLGRSGGATAVKLEFRRRGEIAGADHRGRSIIAVALSPSKRLSRCR